MSKTYTIKRFEMMKVADLSPHPEALIPIDDEDSWAICDSVKAMGAVMDPLLVVIGLNGTVQVVDGCNRLAAAEAAELEEVPCLVVETGDVKSLVMEHLGARRKGSTGQRIMAYLETHRREVLKVAELISSDDAHRASRNRAGHVTGSVIPKNLEHFTAVAIAEKLRVSAKDVGLGIELLQCMEKKMRPSRLLGTDLFPAKPLDMDDQEDKDYLESMRQVRDRLFMGASPIRRWKAACGGISKTSDKERPDIQYGVLASKAMATLMNAFKHWEEISGRERQVLADRWDKVMTAARKANLNG